MSPPPKKPKFEAHIETIKFADGTVVGLAPDAILVVIGPNNSGKSTTLLEIRNAMAGETAKLVIIEEVETRRVTTLKEILAQLAPFDDGNRYVNMPGHGFPLSVVEQWWAYDTKSSMGAFFAEYLISNLSTRARLLDCDPADGFDARAPFSAVHPFQHMFANDEVEQKVSASFRKAFKKDLVVHRTAGQKIPVHVGQRPIPEAGEDRLSRSYVDRIESMDKLELQGDGVRSLASVVGRVVTDERPIQMIDEPEAFLHPPQARVLAEIVAEEGKERQTIIATHSSDVIKGLLKGASDRVSVVRLRRTAVGARASSLSNNAISALWSDPVLRFSNVMDGLFHDGVIVAEAEADCRFYEAMALASIEADGQLDVHYAYSGGKDKVASIVRALRAADVPVASILDFDVLNNEKPLRNIIEALGGNWSDFEEGWTEIKAAVEDRAAFLGGGKFRADLEAVLRTIAKDEAVPKDALKKIRSLTRNASPWDHIKDGGLYALPKGPATVAAENLLNDLAALGLFVAPFGEMEGFYRNVQPKGIAWVEEVVKLDLATDAKLHDARSFVGGVYQFLSRTASA